MKDSNIYIPLWQKLKPIIVSKMKEALIVPQEYPLSRHEFKPYGDRIGSDYTFNLEIENGALINNIGGTAVARDLLEVLKSSKTANELLNKNHFKINLGRDFKLKIQIL
jgi:hypothetical protein